jgi:uracil phosphoribosyltransferase
MPLGCQKNFLIVLDVMVATGVTSIHLVKYSKATTANF